MNRLFQNLQEVFSTTIPIKSSKTPKISKKIHDLYYKDRCTQLSRLLTKLSQIMPLVLVTGKIEDHFDIITLDIFKIKTTKKRSKRHHDLT